MIKFYIIECTNKQGKDANDWGLHCPPPEVHNGKWKFSDYDEVRDKIKWYREATPDWHFRIVKILEKRKVLKI